MSGIWRCCIVGGLLMFDVAVGEGREKGKKMEKDIEGKKRRTCMNRRLVVNMADWYIFFRFRGP